MLCLLLMIPMLALVAFFVGGVVAKASVPPQGVPQYSASGLQWRVVQTNLKYQFALSFALVLGVSMLWFFACTALMIADAQRTMAQFEQIEISHDLRRTPSPPATEPSNIRQNLFFTTGVSTVVLVLGGVGLLLLGRKSYTDLTATSTGVTFKTGFSDSFTADWREIDAVTMKGTTLLFAGDDPYPLPCAMCSAGEVEEILAYLVQAKKAASPEADQPIPDALNELLIQHRQA